MSLEKMIKGILSSATEGKEIDILSQLGKVFGDVDGKEGINPLDILTSGAFGDIGGVLKEGFESLVGNPFCGNEGCFCNGTCRDTDMGTDFDFGPGFFRGSESLFGASNVVESETGFTITVGLPGVSKSDIKISSEDEELVVSVTVAEEKVSEDVETVQNEYTKASIERHFDLYKADLSKLKVSFKNGELKLEVPKVEVEKVFYDIK